MRFSATTWLWLLWLVPLVAVFLVWVSRRRRAMAVRFAASSAWQRLTGGEMSRRRFWRGMLLAGALVLLILGTAGPQWGARAVMLQRRGLDIVVALDVSRSMLAADVKPNRLERAKREIAAVFDRLAGDRIGLVVFSGSAFVQCPLTLDASAARLLLDAVDIRSAGRPGTALDAAITTAAGMFSQDEKQFKILIVVTDGEGTEGDPLTAAQEAAKQGIRIYTVGIGTPAGEPIPLSDEQGNLTGFKKDQNGQVVLSRLDEVTLQKIALATDGRYFRAGPAQMELDELFKELSTLDKKEMEGRLFTEFEQRFQYFLVPAFALLMAEAALPLARRGKRDIQPPPGA
ncbi:MAG: VWA domain-containing protein [Candidatus Zixiibacteriota bacterium]